MSAHRYPIIFSACQKHYPFALALLLLALGAGLRLWQFSADKSLWVDEIALARNFDRPVGELLAKPLVFGQISPRGFVLTEKLLATSLGPSDYVLRLFPLASSFAALIVFWRVGALVFGRRGVLAALALFASAAPLVIYSSQVKQYSSDVLVALLLLWLVLRTAPEVWSWPRAWGIGAAGWIAVFFSHSAVFVLAGIGGALALLDVLKGRAPGGISFRPLPLVLILWLMAAVAGVLVNIATLNPGAQVFLPRYWAVGFPPLSFDEWLANFWPWQPIKQLLSGGDLVTLGYRYPAVCLVLLLLGCLWIGRRDARQLAIIAAPIIAALAAAALRQYPFNDRLILFLLPCFLLLLAAGILWLGDVLARIWRPLAVFLVVYLTGTGVAPIIKAPPPYWTEDAKPVLAYLQSQRRADDAVYVYYGAWQAVQYYGTRYGLSESDYFTGDCYRGSPRMYLDELNRFRGRERLWLVILHASGPYRERDDIIGYLDTIGVRRDHYEVKSRYFRRRIDPAELFLFDLSSAERLRRATAATFAVKGRESMDPRWPCAIHVRPTRPSRLHSAAG